MGWDDAPDTGSALSETPIGGRRQGRGHADVGTKSRSEHLNPHPSMFTLALVPLFAAVGYSLVYLLAGGGFVGAVIIFLVAKIFRK